MKFENYKNKKIYFLGIGGISMYSIALFLKSCGADVFGYDRSESETTKTLIKNGISVFYSPSVENSRGADYCICTAAIGAGNEEYDNVFKNNIPIISRAAALGDIIDNFDNSIGISGTHGKSTTSGMLSQIYMCENRKDPTILMGAVLPAINSAFKIGKTEDLIFEACEYKDSFLNFKPKTAVILNVELDHTDYFPNIEKMKDSFEKYASLSSKVVVNYDSVNALECARNSGRDVITFSVSNKDSDYFACNIKTSREKTMFDLFFKGTLLVDLEIKVFGKHNLSNAIAAAVAAHVNGVSIEGIREGLKTFGGIKRRFEFLGKINGAYVYDDYAHHPDEIRATLEAAKSMSFEKINCVFQPHTYTRLSYFFNDFCDIFNDGVFPIFLPTYGAREKNNLNFDSEAILDHISQGIFIDSLKSVAEYITKNAKENEAYILMGAGDVNHVAQYIEFDT